MSGTSLDDMAAFWPYIIAFAVFLLTTDNELSNWYYFFIVSIGLAIIQNRYDIYSTWEFLDAFWPYLAAFAVHLLTTNWVYSIITFVLLLIMQIRLWKLKQNRADFQASVRTQNKADTKLAYKLLRNEEKAQTPAMRIEKYRKIREQSAYERAKKGPDKKRSIAAKEGWQTRRMMEEDREQITSDIVENNNTFLEAFRGKKRCFCGRDGSRCRKCKQTTCMWHGCDCWVAVNSDA